MAVREVHSWNAYSPIVFKPSGRLTVDRAEQRRKAYRSMAVVVEGNSKEERLVQSPHSSSGIVVRLSESLIEVSDVHPLKAP